MTLSKLLTALAFGAALAAPFCAAGAHAADAAPAARDGAHDFDFDLGVWKTHITRRVHPLTGSGETIRLTGTVTIRKVWDGRGQLEEIEADGPKGHWEGMTLFLYNPQAHQWSMNFANSSNGTLATPMVGSFENGRGELFAQDTLDGRSILVRAVWSDITPTSHTYQESYSADGGRTWEVAFTAMKTKE
ncbi:MAG TPA: hypothetical protein VFG03_05810 [Telluria sp.]|nr:hypothetical protein [Telluria sp.]